MARPVTVSINWKQFEQLCQWRCSSEEIAAFFSIDRNTLYAHVEKEYGDKYSAVVSRCALMNNCSIRGLRFKHAQKNYKAFEEIAARYLGEFPLIETEKQQIDPQLEGKFNSLMAYIEKFQSSDLKIADNNNNEAQKS